MADTAFPHLLIEAQASVEAVLSEALAARGVEVERRAELVDVHRETGAALARVRRSGREELVACRYVAGCDGPASLVRRAAGVGWRGGTYRQEVVLADVELDADLAPDVAHVVAAPGGVLFLFPLGERATWRLLSTRGGRGLRRLRRSARRTGPGRGPPGLHAPRGPGGPGGARGLVGPGAPRPPTRHRRTAPGHCSWSATPPTCTHPPAARA